MTAVGFPEQAIQMVVGQVDLLALRVLDEPDVAVEVIGLLPVQRRRFVAAGSAPVESAPSRISAARRPVPERPQRRMVEDVG